jgi:hypothetical protein
MTNSVIAPNSSSPLKAVGIPWFGLVAVLMGTFISTLNSRLSNFGLADIRGSLGAGFDEGAWITTAQAVGQMLIAPVAVWAGATFGPRRCLIVAASAFASISLILPLSRDLPTLLTLQFASGLASGFFIPLTLSFILPNSAPKFWAFALALYALNLELSLNIAASLEGWYVEQNSAFKPSRGSHVRGGGANRTIDGGRNRAGLCHDINADSRPDGVQSDRLARSERR